MMAYGDQTTLAERKRRAASRMILGFEGVSPTAEFERFARRISPAGYILFARNIEEPAQVLDLNQQLIDFNRLEDPPLLSVDQEGGRVRRIKMTDWPPMRWVGNCDDDDISQQIAAGLAEEVSAMGFNANWAPCADVDSNPDNPVIGDRSFSRDPLMCAKNVALFVKTLHQHGVIACAKHFPGHGDTDLDSHFNLPTVEKDPPDIQACELLPFRAAIAAGVNIIMTAHVIFPAYDEMRPATMSHAILSTVLREELGYGGLIVSDDMEMKAVRGRWDLAEQLDLSCRATLDLYLFCKELELQEEAFEALVHLQEQDKTHDQLAIHSGERLAALRERFFMSKQKRPPLSVVGGAAHRRMSEIVAKRGA